MTSRCWLAVVRFMHTHQDRPHLSRWEQYTLAYEHGCLTDLLTQHIEGQNL